jgi:formylmethanofuran dehydrogenase subunit C
MNVSSVLAATNTYEVYPNSTALKQTNSVDSEVKYFTISGGSMTNTAIVSAADVNEAAGTSLSYTKAPKFDADTKIAFTVNGTASLDIYYSIKTSNSNTITLSLYDAATDQVATTITGNTFTSEGSGVNKGTISNIPSGSYYIKRSAGGEGRFYYVKVVDTVSGDLITTTVTGTAKDSTGAYLASGTTFTVDDMTAKVADNGVWTATKTGTSVAYSVGSSLSVSLNEYDADPATVTLSATDTDNTFSASEITFTKKELGYLAAGTYKESDGSAITAGLPNFEVSDAPGAKVNNGGYIGFKLEKAATVTVNAKIGTSSTDSKTATLFYSTDKTATSGTNVCQLKNGDTTAKDYTINLSEGTYYLICKSPDTDYVSDSGSTSVQVLSITVEYTATDTVVKADDVDKVAVVVPASGDTYYAVLAVSEDTAKKNASFTFGNVSSDTVYESVVIGDKTYQASDFATGAKYLFAVQVTDVTDEADTAVSTIKSGVNVVFTSVATDAE